MNLPCMVNRLEIAFWTTIVGLLQDRHAGSRLARALIVGLVALALLLASAWAQFPSRPAISAAPDQPELNRAAALPVRPANGQSNLLVVMVDHLSAHSPRLQSVWILGRVPALPQVAVLPIYPGTGDLATTTSAVQMLQYAPDDRPGLPDGLAAALNERGLWWDHYLVIDREILENWVDHMGGLEVEGQLYSGRQVVGSLMDPILDSEAKLSRTMEIAQQFCARFGHLSRLQANASVSAVSKQALSDLPAEGLERVLRSLHADGGMACNFPTLNRR